MALAFGFWPSSRAEDGPGAAWAAAWSRAGASWELPIEGL